MKTKLALLGAVYCALAEVCLLYASSICVKVVDPPGYPVHGVWVKTLNLQSNDAFSAVTDRDGHVCVSRIPEGLYSVEVGRLGFLNVRYYPVRVTTETTQTLNYTLPFGEITEGGMDDHESLISGTLMNGRATVEDAKVCVYGLDNGPLIACTKTTDLGEYALSLPLGTYAVEVTGREIPPQHLRIDVSIPGKYRNLIKIAPVVPK